jgi:hypothetical protein
MQTTDIEYPPGIAIAIMLLGWTGLRNDLFEFTQKTEQADNSRTPAKK